MMVHGSVNITHERVKNIEKMELIRSIKESMIALTTPDLQAVETSKTKHY